MNNNNNEVWDDVISADRGLLDFRLGEIWKRRDLLFMFVWRDFRMTYKQTVLGLLWLVLQPVMMMLVYYVVFSKIARIPTDGAPPGVFYLSGIIMWNFFANSFNQTVNTFKQNTTIFGKVYFPRLIIPLAKFITALGNFITQLCLLTPLLIYFAWKGDIHANNYMLIVPGLMLITGFMGMGLGLIISSLSVTFRDLMFIVGFGMQLLMFASAVIYPVSIIPEPYRSIILWNPLVNIFEAFRYGLLGVGDYSVTGLVYASIVACAILVSGILIFNKVEQSYIDSI